MKPSSHVTDVSSQTTWPLPEGPAAAAVLSAGIGCFAVGVFAVLGDKYSAIAHWFSFYRPTGPLSGVSTLAILLWLGTWVILARLWRDRTVRLKLVSTVAFLLLASSIVLTFPPFAELIVGR